MRQAGARLADAGPGDRPTDGVFAEEWQPLGDGAAPWSRWRGRGPAVSVATASNGHGAVAAKPGSSEMTYLEAISDALRVEMRRDRERCW